jgi:hypothetical protein
VAQSPLVVHTLKIVMVNCQCEVYPLFIKFMKLKVYQIIIGVSIALLAGLFLGRFEITISNGSNLPSNLPEPATVLPPIPPFSPTATSAADLAKGLKSEPIPTTPEPDGELISPIATSPAANTLANAKAVGTLRVSNRTEHPVRVALLTKRQAEKSYGKPAHWDFAPGEGGSKGLMLSLPEGKLKVRQGDILVVFAQDGSRRYWGPYVTGETASPAWNTKSGEWQLVVQP